MWLIAGYSYFENAGNVRSIIASQRARSASLHLDWAPDDQVLRPDNRCHEERNRTTLFDALAQHPAIAPCTPKEPGFFAFEEVWAQGFDWYESLFHFDPHVHRFALDGSTDYTKRPFCDGVAARLAASAPRDFH